MPESEIVKTGACLAGRTEDGGSRAVKNLRKPACRRQVCILFCGNYSWIFGKKRRLETVSAFALREISATRNPPKVAIGSSFEDVSQDFQSKEKQNSDSRARSKLFLRWMGTSELLSHRALFTEGIQKRFSCPRGKGNGFVRLLRGVNMHRKSILKGSTCAGMSVESCP